MGSGSRDSMHVVQAGCACGWLEVHGFADGNNTFWIEQILLQNNSDQELVKHDCIFLHLSIHAGGMQAQLIIIRRIAIADDSFRTTIIKAE